MSEIPKALQEEALAIGKRCADLVLDLVSDGERAAVILAAARVDIALEELLRTVLSPCTGGQDDLFDTERPVSSFSAKITLTFRLGLITPDLERAIQLLRKIRNEVAHSHARISLSSGSAANRLGDLKRACEHADVYVNMAQELATREVPTPLLQFSASIGVILARVEVARLLAARYRPKFVLSIKSVQEG